MLGTQLRASERVNLWCRGTGISLLTPENNQRLIGTKGFGAITLWLSLARKSVKHHSVYNLLRGVPYHTYLSPRTAWSLDYNSWER